MCAGATWNRILGTFRLRLTIRRIGRLVIYYPHAIALQHNSALQKLSLCLSSLGAFRALSHFRRAAHTKLQQRCRACSWAGVHVELEVRRACPVREELAAGLTAAQGYGAPLRLPRDEWKTFASLPKHRGSPMAHAEPPDDG